MNMISLILFIVSALIGSGVLFTHKRALTYLAFAGVLFEAEFLLTALLRRTIIHTIDGPTLYMIAGIIFTAIWLALYKEWKSPYSAPGSGKRDAYTGITLLIVVALAFPIIKANGFIGEEFIMHGFYNGDTATFVSLIQKSFYTNGLVHENPFAGNGSLEYPTLLHGAFADFFSLMNIGTDLLRYLGIITYAQILITIPMLFLLWDTVFPEPKNSAELWFGVPKRTYIYGLQTILTLGAIFLSLDSYVYPQSHFFLIGLFLGLVALFAKASTLTHKKQLLPVASALACAILLLLANTVTGTAAAACAGAFVFVRIFDKKRLPYERILYLAIGIVIVLCMQRAGNGRVNFNDLHFSVSSAGDMMRAGIPMLLVFAAGIYAIARKQYIAVASTITALLGFATFFLADRNIVTENASRFLYHGFLVGFPLLLGPLVQYLYFIRRELQLTSRPMSEKIVGYIAVICMITILLLPIGVSAGSTYVNLLKNDKHVISFNDRVALYWIEGKTKPTDIIIASPNEPYAIPVFTGRSVLRLHDYWLSPQDKMTDELVRAFAGDKEAQKKILKLGQFLFLSKEDATHWDTTGLKKITDSGDAIIYKAQ